MIGQRLVYREGRYPLPWPFSQLYRGLKTGSQPIEGFFMSEAIGKATGMPISGISSPSEDFSEKDHPFRSNHAINP